MPGQRRDYLMHQIDLLRQFVARLVDGHANAGLEDMLQLAFSLQEKLFGRPPAEFLALEVSAQIASLRAGETDAVGREKCLTYARLLQHTAALYDHRGRSDLGAGARQLALHVSLAVGLENRADLETAELIESLAGTLDPTELHPPVAELLADFRDV
jgi:alkylation response protein AidB-like acyl-CoA dehydrogenase